MIHDSRRSHRRIPTLVAAVAVMALLGAGCAHDNTPQSYETTTPGNPIPVDEYNFVQGCTGASTATTLASTELCQCMIDWTMVNVPASDSDKNNRTNPDGSKTFANYTGPTFNTINKNLISDPNSLPDFVQQGYASACSAVGYPKPAGSTSGTAPLAPSTTLS